ncbi:MAG: hypothetical protein Tsb002_14480 [Wenzhouxiangellaceae bacterium]
MPQPIQRRFIVRLVNTIASALFCALVLQPAHSQDSTASGTASPVAATLELKRESDHGPRTIHGHLTLPGNGQRVPLLIIASLHLGSMPAADNKPVMDTAQGQQPLSQLSQALAEKHQIGALLIDLNQTIANTSHFAEFAGDLAAAYDHFAGHHRVQAMLLGGHGDGALAALMAMDQRPAAGYIGLTLAGMSGAQLEREHFQQLNDDSLRQQALTLNEQLTNGQPPQALPEALHAVYGEVPLELLRSWYALRPTTLFSRVRQPLLVIHGDADRRLDDRHGRLLRYANTGANIERLPGMDHHLASSGVEPPQLHPDVSALLAAFIHASVNQAL